MRLSSYNPRGVLSLMKGRPVTKLSPQSGARTAFRRFRPVLGAAMKRLPAFAIVTVVLLTIVPHAGADDSQNVYLPLIGRPCGITQDGHPSGPQHCIPQGRPHPPGPGPVRQITIKARLASYEPASETCRIPVSDSRLQLGRLPLDNAAQIRIVDAETGEVLERGLGEAEAVVYAAMNSPTDTDFAYGISFNPAVAPRRPCPNLMRHTEEFVNVVGGTPPGIYTIVNVLHYDPTRQ